MKKIVIYAIFILIIPRPSYGDNFELPLEFEITEDAINLFLLKQYKDLGNSRFTTYNYEGVTYQAELLPIIIDLKNDAAATHLRFQLGVTWGENSTSVSFSHYISFAVSNGEANAEIIIEGVRSGIQSNENLPDAVKNFLLSAYDNLELKAYPQSLMDNINDDILLEEHPIELLSPVQVSWEVSESKLDLTLTLRFSAEAPKMELMLTDDDEIRCRTNFKAEFLYAIFNYGDLSPLIEVPWANYGYEYTYDGQLYNKTRDRERCIILVENSKNAYKAYFDIESLTPNVWIQPHRFN
ncbi:hypothetical protein [Reichenbachiella sp.]|uniref:hypothetical protein n=1 Tax=Reichenbachiella sp. TaxID=2184521 RepID=UPI003BAEF078